MKYAILVCTAVVLARAVGVSATDVTTCGQTIAERDTGVLVADLDCSNVGDEAIRLLSRATLDLDGHTLTGGPVSPTVIGVAAADGSGHGRFTIRGPGVIAGTAVPHPQSPTGNACIILNDGRAVITSATGVVEIRGCETGLIGTATGFDRDGRARLKMDHVDLHDNLLDGSAVRTIVASDLSIRNHVNGLGLEGARVKLTNVFVSGNNVGVGSIVLRVDGGTVVGNEGTDHNGSNGVGLFAARRTVVSNLVIMNNHAPGVEGLRVLVTNCQLSNNGIDPPHLHVDIAADTKPVLVNTTCQHSEVTGNREPRPPTYPNWGVCADD